MIKCPYEHCDSKEITAIGYRETHRDGQLTCLTYECICRECERGFARSMNLGVN